MHHYKYSDSSNKWLNILISYIYVFITSECAFWLPTSPLPDDYCMLYFNQLKQRRRHNEPVMLRLIID